MSSDRGQRCVMRRICFFFFKQKTAYEMRISDWSSDVCSSDLVVITAMEDAIQKAAKSRYGSENEIKAEVDPKTGEIRLARLLEVVEEDRKSTRLNSSH